MKNEKIINAWDKMKPSDETKEMIFNETMRKYEQSKRISIVRPRRIIAVMVSIAVIAALFSMQAIIAFIGGLFFVPGVGITRNPPRYEGLEAPVDIETEYGLITVKFVSKLTSDGKSDLGIYLYSVDIPAQTERNYPVDIIISADGEIIDSKEKLGGSGGWGSDGRNYVSYMYICEDFPDVSEFDLTILGIETHINLTEQLDNYAFSEEHNDITLAVSKFNTVNDMITFGVFDNSESACDYYVVGSVFIGSSYFAEDGEEISLTSGFGGLNPESPMNYWINEFYQNETPIKTVKVDRLEINYQRKEMLPIEIPVPKDGETIQTDIEIPIGSHTYRITEVRREGDTIYYENNSCEVLSKKSHADRNIGSFSTEGLPMDNLSPEWEQAVANSKSFIQWISVGHEGDWDVNKSKMGGGEIWDFDENAETLTFWFSGATVIQFGNFDVEFD